MLVWRLAHPHRPCDFVPRHFCSWKNRFDDPRKLYRTVYTARLPITCLRELLADLRPNGKAIAEFETVFGGEGQGLTIAGVVSQKWRKAHVLVESEPESLTGRLVAIEAPYQRKRLEKSHASLLKRHGITHLDIATMRSRFRPLSRAFSRALYDGGYCGVTFHSRLDGKPCQAFFEGRAKLRQRGKAISMTENHPDLIRVCGEYTLVLRS
jgi:hypothetical protein